MQPDAPADRPSRSVRIRTDRQQASAPGKHAASERPRRVSICVANYDGEALLGDCLDSIVQQETDVDIEIIVHDDASPDRSIQLLEDRFPQARLLRSDANVGFCIANNRMVAAATGDFILLLNNDAALFPDAVATLLAEWDRMPGSILTLPQYGWDDGDLVNLGCRLDPFYNVVPAMAPGPSLAMVEGACLFMERALWNRLGGFPPAFGSIAEDTLLCCSARLAGAQVGCAHSSGYRHRQGASFGGNRLADAGLVTRYRRRYLSERNRIALLASCAPGWLVFAWLPAHLVLLLVEAALLSLAMGSLQPWRKIYSPALRDAWKQRRATMDLRRHVQALRRIGVWQYLQGFTWVPHRLRLLVRHGIPRISD